MNISFAWTTSALLANRKKVTRRNWSKAYAARFRNGSVHNAYDRQARFGGKKIGNIKITTPVYVEQSCDIPDQDYDLEGFAYLEENGILIREISPQEFFDNWRKSSDVLFVVRFDLVFHCQRCGTWTSNVTFGPNNDKRLCALCWVDWGYYSDTKFNRARASSASWEELYLEFCATERKGALP
jgi:hypothetical protein